MKPFLVVAHMRLWGVCMIATLAFVTSAMLSTLPSVPADESPLVSWNCSLDEDIALGKKSNAAHANVNGSLGFVLLVLGPKAEWSFHIFIMCIRASFGDKLGIFAHRPTLSCSNFKQGIKIKEQWECWGWLMAEKFTAARLSPFDISVLIDTDVFANPTTMNTDFLPQVRHALAAKDILFTFPAMKSHLNGGFVIFRKSPQVDRYFRCGQMMIERSNWGIQDQDVFNKLFWAKDRPASISLSSLKQGTLPENKWQCRTWPYPINFDNSDCVFVHSKPLKPEARKVCGGWKGKAAQTTSTSQDATKLGPT